MSFKAFLGELSLLIHNRAVISCVYPKLVALETIQELANLNCAYPGLISTSGAEVRTHLQTHAHPAVLFITEHLDDGDGLDLIRDLHQQNNELDHRAVLILTHNHKLSGAALRDPSISGVVLDQNIGTPGCALVQALRAVNTKGRFVDPDLQERSDHGHATERSTLTDREREVLKLVADGLSNREIADHLYLAPTTVRDHVQAIMRKLKVHSRTGAAVAGLRRGLLES